MKDTDQWREAYEQDRYERARQLAWRTGDMVRAIQEDALLTAGWRPMREAQKDSTSVTVLMRDGTVHRIAHWASNTSGEEQPPYEGWFVHKLDGNYNVGIPEPIGWRKIQAEQSADASGNAPGKHFGPN